MPGYSAELVVLNLKEDARHKEVPLTAIYMQESEQRVLMYNEDDEEWSFGSGRFYDWSTYEDELVS